jgi:hypothetical protein
MFYCDAASLNVALHFSRMRRRRLLFLFILSRLSAALHPAASISQVMCFGPRRVERY